LRVLSERVSGGDGTSRFNPPLALLRYAKRSRFSRLAVLDQEPSE